MPEKPLWINNEPTMFLEVSQFSAHVHDDRTKNVSLAVCSHDVCHIVWKAAEVLLGSHIFISVQTRIIPSHTQCSSHRVLLNWMLVSSFCNAISHLSLCLPWAVLPPPSAVNAPHGTELQGAHTPPPTPLFFLFHLDEIFTIKCVK